MALGSGQEPGIRSASTGIINSLKGVAIFFAIILCNPYKTPSNHSDKLR